MYNEIITYLKGLLTTYDLDKYDPFLQGEEATITNDVSQYYINKRNRPVICIPHIFSIYFKQSMEQGNNSDTDFRNDIETFIESQYIGEKTAKNEPTTINSQECYLQLLSLQNGWGANEYQSKVRLQVVYIKSY
jgi:hypothetical protein